MNNKEIKEIPTGELVSRYKEEKARLQKLKLNHAVSKLEEPHQIKESRKNIARFLTEINSRRTDSELKASEKNSNQ